MQHEKNRTISWFMWSLPLTFFAFQFILRLYPGLIKEELSQRFLIDATAFGDFAAMYYLGYAGMQIPIASLLDKFGPRKIIGLSVLTCALACWLLMTTEYWPFALLSRFLIGAGSVVGFLGTSKVISQWFPKARYARMVGLTFSFGLLGALYGGKPISLMIEKMGWQTVLGWLALCSLGLAVLFFVFLKSPKTQHDETASETQPMLASAKAFFSHKSLLVIALANFLMVGSLEGFADVWGVPYFMGIYELSKSDAAALTSCVFFGMLFGGPILAFFSERYQKHLLVTFFSGVSMSALLATVFVFNAQLPLWLVYGMMFLVGIFCCYQVIVFAIGSNLVNPAMMGFTIAALNCINMLGGVFFHRSIGRLMDWFWDGTMLNGVKVYSTGIMTQALWLVPLSALLGSFLILGVQWRLKTKLVTQPVAA